MNTVPRPDTFVTMYELESKWRREGFSSLARCLSLSLSFALLLTPPLPLSLRLFEERRFRSGVDLDPLLLLGCNFTPREGHLIVASPDFFSVKHTCIGYFAVAKYSILGL